MKKTRDMNPEGQMWNFMRIDVHITAQERERIKKGGGKRQKTVCVKGIVQPKMKILSLITHPHFGLNL